MIDGALGNCTIGKRRGSPICVNRLNCAHPVLNSPRFSPGIALADVAETETAETTGGGSLVSGSRVIILDGRRDEFASTPDRRAS